MTRYPAPVTSESAKKHRRRPVTPADPSSTVTPGAKDAAASVATPKASEAPIDAEQLHAAILRFLRRFPNQTVDLAPLAVELGIDPYRVQLEVENLHRRRMVVAPFIEPGAAGGATLTEVGLRWLIKREGGKPSDVPVALKPAKERVRPEDEASRLPRAEVYGLVRGSSA